MRDAVTWAALLGAAATLLALRPADVPPTPLTERLAARLAGTDRNPPAPPDAEETEPAPAAPDPIAPDPPPQPAPDRPGSPAPASLLRAEAVAMHRDPDSVLARERADRWLVYRTPDGAFPGRGPRLHPLTGPGALVLDGDAVFLAGWLTSGDEASALWRVVYREPREPQEDHPLLAVGSEPDAMVVLLTDADRARARTRAWRCHLVAAPPRALAFVHPAPPPPPPAGEVTEIAPPGAPLRVTLDGVTFESVDAGDATAPVPALRAGGRIQSFATVDVAGTPVPLLFSWGETVQRAGVVRLDAAPEPVRAGPFTFTPVLDRTEVAALGADGLVHSVPGLR